MSWEEEFLLQRLNEIGERLSSNDLPEETALRLLGLINIYFENVALRSDEQATIEISTKFSEIYYFLKNEIGSVKPLSTQLRDQQIALLIDFLVFNKSPKGKVILSVSEWLGMGIDLVEKLAKAHCSLKFDGKILTGNTRKFQSTALLSSQLRPLFLQEKRPFHSDNKNMIEAFERMRRDALEVGVK